MTREDQISLATRSYVDDKNYIDFVAQAFTDGVKWADKHPKQEVTSLVENTECLFQFNGLLVSWKKFNLQSQFHITNIQNYFEILKYLKETIMSNLTKDGIVVQFLPEAKDFCVSLNQVL